MRRGTIFERAVTWVGLFGLMFALGAGQALAQTTIGIEDVYFQPGSKASGTHAVAGRNPSGGIHVIGEGISTNLVVVLDRAIPTNNDPNTMVEVELELDVNGVVLVGVGETREVGVGTADAATAGYAEAEDFRSIARRPISGTNALTPFGSLDGTASANIIGVGESGATSNGPFFREGERTHMIPVVLATDTDAFDEDFTITVRLEAEGSFNNNGTGQYQTLRTRDVAKMEKTLAVRIMDLQEQAYNLVLATNVAPREAAPFTISLLAQPEVPDIEKQALAVELDVEVDDGYTVAGPSGNWDDFTTGTEGVGGSTTASMGDGSRIELTVTPPTNDKNRIDDDITIAVYDAGRVTRARKLDELTFNVKDRHHLPAEDDVVATAFDRADADEGRKIDEVEEGDSFYLEVEVDRGTVTDQVYDNEVLTVALKAMNPAQNEDFRVTPASLMVPVGSGKTKARADVDDAEPSRFTIEVMGDSDVGDETLMFDVEVTGEMSGGKPVYGEGMTVGMFSIDVVDGTEKLIRPKSDADVMREVGDNSMLVQGESFELDADSLFVRAEGVDVDDVTYGAIADMPDVAMVSVSGSMLHVSAMSDGEAMITVTGTVTDQTGASSAIPQTSPVIAQVMFSVTVEGAPLTYTLKANSDVLVEGERLPVILTAEVSEAAISDTVVKVMRDGESSAGMDDYMLEPMEITIMAGATTGTAHLTAVEDMMMEEVEMLYLYGTVDGQAIASERLMFTIYDMAMPALPLVAQLLLAAFLGLGGYRRYLRRRS